MNHQNATDMIPPLYTTTEAAKILRVSEYTLRQKISEGLIDSYKNPGKNGRILVSEEHIKNYLTACNV